MTLGMSSSDSPTDLQSRSAPSRPWNRVTLRKSLMPTNALVKEGIQILGPSTLSEATGSGLDWSSMIHNSLTSSHPIIPLCTWRSPKDNSNQHNHEPERVRVDPHTGDSVEGMA